MKITLILSAALLLAAQSAYAIPSYSSGEPTCEHVVTCVRKGVTCGTTTSRGKIVDGKCTEDLKHQRLTSTYCNLRHPICCRALSCRAVVLPYPEEVPSGDTPYDDTPYNDTPYGDTPYGDTPYGDQNVPSETSTVPTPTSTPCNTTIDTPTEAPNSTLNETVPVPPVEEPTTTPCETVTNPPAESWGSTLPAPIATPIVEAPVTTPCDTNTTSPVVTPPEEVLITTVYEETVTPSEESWTTPSNTTVPIVQVPTPCEDTIPPADVWTTTVTTTATPPVEVQTTTVTTTTTFTPPPEVWTTTATVTTTFTPPPQVHTTTVTVTAAPPVATPTKTSSCSDSSTCGTIPSGEISHNETEIPPHDVEIDLIPVPAPPPVVVSTPLSYYNPLTHQICTCSPAPLNYTPAHQAPTVPSTSEISVVSEPSTNNTVPNLPETPYKAPRPCMKKSCKKTTTPVIPATPVSEISFEEAKVPEPCKSKSCGDSTTPADQISFEESKVPESAMNNTVPDVVPCNSTASPAEEFPVDYDYVDGYESF